MQTLLSFRTEFVLLVIVWLCTVNGAALMFEGKVAKATVTCVVSGLALILVFNSEEVGQFIVHYADHISFSPDVTYGLMLSAFVVSAILLGAIVADD